MLGAIFLFILLRYTILTPKKKIILAGCFSRGITLHHIFARFSSKCLKKFQCKTLIVESKNSVIPTDGRVNSIAAFAFSGSSIKSIAIPVSVTNIGNYVFNSFSNLKSIISRGTVEQWNNITKGYGWIVYNKTIYCTDDILTT